MNQRQHQITREQQQKAEQLQRQHQAQQARQQRLLQAVEQQDHAKNGQRIWVVPEFDMEMMSDEEEYILESIREALPEYDIQMALDKTEPMTEERIFEMLAGGSDEPEEDE